ncbi:serpentine type 7TM GPCR chemoreceptor srt domain-containing protein [Ditylenchus destructor]|uniref:Serpentine type 7TM GPCR chemoreceptor srt domain-containing protein n=1 Tax=Ditylenchus destructor TaxID=166010 RepID=A0AAD4MJP0_9BILA|nr:serpentine type 7TM GPCR chemoreceptor srt domain-containing protein [Ditylenchus destructor]
MEFFLFRRSEYDKLYNCSYDIDSIPIENRKHEFHGILTLVLSTLFVLVYIPTLSVIMRKYLRKTAYQLMFVVGFADVLMLSIVAMLCGSMSVTGAVYCSAPTPIYVISCLGMGFWVLSTESSVILALYRCMELWRPHVADRLFAGKRALVWISLSLLHFVAVFSFGTPIVYSSLVGTMLLNPHAGYIEDKEERFSNQHHKLYNSALFFVLIGLYIAFVCLIVSKRKLMTAGPSRQMLATQRKSLIQALVICSCGAISDAYWFVVFLGPSPPQIAIFVGVYTWICSHGVPGIVYISMNRTIRGSIFKAFKTRTKPVIVSTMTSRRTDPNQ